MRCLKIWFKRNYSQELREVSSVDLNFRDENVIGTFVVEKKCYCLLVRFEFTGLIGTVFKYYFLFRTTLRKNDKEDFGTFIIVLRMGYNKQIGIGLEWNIGNHKYPITDVEKTLVDCFDQPQYSGGYAELIRALTQADINVEKI